MTNQQITSNLYYLQIDHRFEGDNSWEELVVCSSTPEEAIKLTGLDIYQGKEQQRIYIEIIGVSLNKPRGIVCVGDHSHKESFELIKEEIRYNEEM